MFVVLEVVGSLHATSSPTDLEPEAARDLIAHRAELVELPRATHHHQPPPPAACGTCSSDEPRRGEASERVIAAESPEEEDAEGEGG